MCRAVQSWGLPHPTTLSVCAHSSRAAAEGGEEGGPDTAGRCPAGPKPGAHGAGQVLCPLEAATATPGGSRGGAPQPDPSATWTVVLDSDSPFALASSWGCPEAGISPKNHFPKPVGVIQERTGVHGLAACTQTQSPSAQAGCTCPAWLLLHPAAPASGE